MPGCTFRTVLLLILAGIVSGSCDATRPSRPSPFAESPSAAAIVMGDPVAATATVPWACLGSASFRPAGCPARLNRVTAAGITGAAAVVPTKVEVVATVTGNRVLLTWTTPLGGDPPTSYVLEVGSVPGASDLVNTDLGSPATFLTADNVPSATYYVRVRGRNAGGTGPPSNEVTLLVTGTFCTAAPSAPGTLAGSIAHLEFSVSWGSSPFGATSYVIEAGSAPGLTNLANFDTGNLLTSFSASVDPGSYFVRVRARNACGLSSASNEIAAHVPGYSVAFRPLLGGPNLSPCGKPTPGAGICAQEFTPHAAAGGEFHDVWESVLKVDGLITAAQVFATMQCTNGAASGSFSGAWDGSKYVGTWTFNGASGPVRVERGSVDTQCKVP